MKYLKIILLNLILFSSMLFPQEERKVLVEVFTNSHCPLCPPAHNVITNYLAGPNGDKISYIYYHMIYPYSDDPLYWESMEGSDARDNYYNPVNATPQGWFEGVHQSSHTGWMASLDNLVMQESPLRIILTGTRTSAKFNVNAELIRTGNIPDSDIVIHFIVVEDLFFDGRNTISNHKQVMRKMLPAPDGQAFSINLNETINIEQAIEIESGWDADSLSVVVFVQSSGSKTVYQSETIGHGELIVSVKDESEIIPEGFILKQNFPNPFNPKTKITFVIGHSSIVSLKVYDDLGNEITTLVNKELPAGEYEIEFNGQEISSGIYFYRLKAEDYTAVRKMILIK